MIFLACGVCSDNRQFWVNIIAVYMYNSQWVDVKENAEALFNQNVPQGKVSELLLLK